MKASLNTLLGAAALAALCHAPAGHAAYATASADATLVITSGTGYESLGVEVTPSTSQAAVGDALADAQGQVLPLNNGLFTTGTVSADALFPPASVANASFGSVQPLFVINTSGASNLLEFSFDWSYALNALNDFVAPSEVANTTLSIKLQQVSHGDTMELFSQSAFADIVSGADADAGSLSFSYELAPGELTTFLVEINATSFAATAVPLPAPALLLAPALGMLVLRRRAAA